MRFCRILAGIIGLLASQYSGTESFVKLEVGDVSSFFPLKTGVRQECIPDPSLIITYIDWVLGRVVD